MGRKMVRSLAAREWPRLTPDLTDLVHGLVKSLIDPYRPELHYMRGPGPKWRAKHERAPRATADAAVLAPAWFGECSRRSDSSATSRVAANGSKPRSRSSSAIRGGARRCFAFIRSASPAKVRQPGTRAPSRFFQIYSW